MSRRQRGAQRRERFERLFADHYAMLLAYALRRTTPSEADDVVAETFLVLWRRLDEAPADVRPWLFGVARRALADRRRAERRRAALAARYAAEVSPASGDEDEHGRLLRALARLSERDRELLLLVAWDGLTPREAAVALGLSRVALRLRLHRARRQLALELEREPAGLLPRPRNATLKVEEA